MNQSLKPMLGYDNAKESKYYQDLDSLDNLKSNIVDSLKNELKYEFYNTYLVPININGKMYLSWYAWNNSIAKTATILIDYDFDNDNIRDDVISNAMDKIENYRLSKEMIKQINAGYLVKKLGLHPDMIEN